MKRFMVLLWVCLLLTPNIFAAEEVKKEAPPPAAKEVPQKTDDIVKTRQQLDQRAKQLNAQQAELDKRTKQLDTQQVELNKQAKQLKIDHEQANATKIKLDAQQSALIKEQPKTNTPTEDSAKAIVEGPDKAELGTLVVLNASESSAAAFLWIADGLSPDQYNVDSSGMQLYFAAPCEAGLYKFVLSVALDNTVDALIHTVVVGDAPDPPDPPEPPEPPLTGFTKEIFDWAIELVPEEVLKKPAGAFYSNYMTIVSQIEAGALDELEKVDWEITKLNRAAVNDQTRKQWLPWFEKLKERFDELEAADKLNTVQDASKLFQEIAKALEELK